jgi:hypothetical protein
VSADLLHRAAVKLREHADRAPEGPWVSLDGGDRLVALRENREHFPKGFRYVVDEPIDDASIAEYIALMHPPVALALAELLDAEADLVHPNTIPANVKGARRLDALAALAREILREPS